MCWKVQPDDPFEITSLESQAVTDLRSSIITNTSVELLDDCYEGLGLNVTLEEVSSMLLLRRHQGLSLCLHFSKLPLQLTLLTPRLFDSMFSSVIRIQRERADLYCMQKQR